MKHRQVLGRKHRRTKSVLRLLDLEHAKSAVLNSLTSSDAQRGYRHAIDEFVDWYCSEPRLAFNRIVVLRYRSHLESRQLAPVRLHKQPRTLQSKFTSRKGPPRLPFLTTKPRAQALKFGGAAAKLFEKLCDVGEKRIAEMDAARL